MSDFDLEAWGRMEFYARLEALKTRTPEGLLKAQQEAKQRAIDAGLSASDIAYAVMQARREWRIQQERAAS